MEPNADAMSMQLKQRVVMQFLTVKKTPHRHSSLFTNCLYCNEILDRSTVSLWASKCKQSEPDKEDILDEL